MYPLLHHYFIEMHVKVYELGSFCLEFASFPYPAYPASRPMAAGVTNQNSTIQNEQEFIDEERVADSCFGDYLFLLLQLVCFSQTSSKKTP